MRTQLDIYVFISNVPRFDVKCVPLLLIEIFDAYDEDTPILRASKRNFARRNKISLGPREQAETSLKIVRLHSQWVETRTCYILNEWFQIRTCETTFSMGGFKQELAKFGLERR